jgi:hypothetical protein
MSLSEPTGEPVERTWVAGRGTAWSAASALTWLETTRPRFLMFAGAVVLGLPALLVTAGQQGTAFDLVLGLVLAAFLLACGVVISAWSRARAFRVMLPPGHRLTCRIGDDHLLLRDADSETRVQFDRYARMDVVDHWVILGQRSRRVRVLYPRALFDPDDLARLRLTIMGSALDGQ